MQFTGIDGKQTSLVSWISLSDILSCFTSQHGWPPTLRRLHVVFNYQAVELLKFDQSKRKSKQTLHIISEYCDLLENHRFFRCPEFVTDIVKTAELWPAWCIVLAGVQAGWPASWGSYRKLWPGAQLSSSPRLADGQLTGLTMHKIHTKLLSSEFNVW